MTSRYDTDKCLERYWREQNSTIGQIVEEETAKLGNAVKGEKYISLFQVVMLLIIISILLYGISLIGA